MYMCGLTECITYEPCLPSDRVDEEVEQRVRPERCRSRRTTYKRVLVKGAAIRMISQTSPKSTTWQVNFLQNRRDVCFRHGDKSRGATDTRHVRYLRRYSE